MPLKANLNAITVVMFVLVIWKAEASKLCTLHLPISVYKYLIAVSNPFSLAWSITYQIFTNCVAAGIWSVTFSQNIGQVIFV